MSRCTGSPSISRENPEAQKTARRCDVSGLGSPFDPSRGAVREDAGKGGVENRERPKRMLNSRFWEDPAPSVLVPTDLGNMDLETDVLHGHCHATKWETSTTTMTTTL